MKFFSKKKEEENFIFEDEMPAFTFESLPNEQQKKPTPEHMLTPEEILGKEEVKEEFFDGPSALESLKKRLSSVVEGSDLSEDKSISSKTQETRPAEDTEKAVKAEYSEEKAASDAPKRQDTQADAPEEVLRKPTLLDKCLPYIIDDDGKEVDPNSKPLYELQSVADILKSESEKMLQKLSEKYDVAIDDLGHTSELLKAQSEKKATPTEKKAEPIKAKPQTSVEYKATEKETFEEYLPVKNQVKNVQSNVPFVISDIDMSSSGISDNVPEQKEMSSTITFTPVNDGSSQGTRISVSTQTRPIDLTGELVRIPEVISENTEEDVKLQKNDFEEYVPKEEFTEQAQAAKFVRKFSIIKRRTFIQTVFSFFITILLCLCKLPFITELLLAHTAVGMGICAGITGVAMLINFDMFKALPRIFSRRSNPDICVLLACVTTGAYAVFGIIEGSIITDILILLAGILSFRALGSFLHSAHMLSNFKQISTSAQKRAVKLINDRAITFSMAKNFIEGDVLIAAPQKCDHIYDYMRYTTFGSFIGGKLPVITIVALLLSAIVGIACGFYFDGVVHGLYAAAAIQCFTALPVAFFIDNLPLYRTANKLNRKGAMIAGKAGAEQIEMANAVVLNANDIFPSGTVTLHQMQVLSENNLEDTIIRAASLCDALDSTLAPIFKKIAGTGNISVLPDSDTVKYEDTLGISGWVDNRLLFIGNRTLMESHGISVPSVEVDRKILRQGYFPVYVATQEKACALLMVQYNVDNQISHELRKLTALGVTVLVNSSDPNLTEEMICDYMGLYEDSVKVMSAAGCHMYKVTVVPTKAVSAPAAYRSSPVAMASIINCATRIKKSNLLLTALYVIFAVLGTVIFAYTSLGGSGTLISDTTLLIYGAVSTVVSYLLYLLQRP